MYNSQKNFLCKNNNNEIAAIADENNKSSTAYYYYIFNFIHSIISRWLVCDMIFFSLWYAPSPTKQSVVF